MLPDPESCWRCCGPPPWPSGVYYEVRFPVAKTREDPGQHGNDEQRHHFIIAEIAAVASQTPDRFTAQGDAYLPDVLAVLILYASRTEDGFVRIVGVLGKLLA